MNNLELDADLVPRILAAAGLDWSERGPWLVVGNTPRVSGWKLHISAIPVEAEALLGCVVPLLAERRVAFKVGRDLSVLIMLNAGDLGQTQIGKFMTVYPASDAEAVKLARTVTAATRHFSGPAIPTDVWLDAVVYARDGAFNPVIAQDRLGRRQHLIYAEAGELKPDRYPTPFYNKNLPKNPFETVTRPSSASHPETGSGPRMLGPGFRLVEVLEPNTTGSVFLAVDLRSPDDIGLKVLKEGRPHCHSDLLGRDIRDRLQHEAEILRLVEHLSVAPKQYGYFLDGDTGYLALEYIEGISAEQFASAVLGTRPWGEIGANAKRRVLTVARRLVQSIDMLHQVGCVHRDLSARNIRICSDDSVRIIDFGLAWLTNSTKPPFLTGTPGFMSPSQALHGEPCVEDDLYALGCMLILLFTGLDPRRVLFGGHQELSARLAWLMRVERGKLTNLVSACTDPDPRRRPSCVQIRAVLDSAAASLAMPVGAARQVCRGWIKQQLHEVLTGAAATLCEEAALDPASGLWLSARGTDDNFGPGAAFEVRRDVHQGAAGVLYVLSQLERCGFRLPEKYRATVAGAADWLIRDLNNREQLTGLYFGRSGQARSLADTANAGLIADGSAFRDLIGKSLPTEFDWPDLTHGAAGQGLAAVYLNSLWGTSRFEQVAESAATYLLSGQSAQGEWTLPPGVEGLSGQSLTGFAHGAAGILYFLAEYAEVSGDKSVKARVETGVERLLARASRDSQSSAYEWPYSDTDPVKWKWWCHGSPGIALLFLRLFERFGDRRYADIARDSLRQHPPAVRVANLGQCHGLAGLGEIYLEATRVLDDTHFHDRAHDIAVTLLSLAERNTSGNASWVVENADAVTADLMLGMGGVFHFLLRAAGHFDRIGLPLLCDPIKVVGL